MITSFESNTIFDTGLSQPLNVYAPLTITDLQYEQQTLPADNNSWRADATFRLAWRGRSINCIAEIIGHITPRQLRDKIAKLKNVTSGVLDSGVPILVVPYLSEAIVAEFKRGDISGLDLNGNYIILTDELVALRLDQPNAYPYSRDIKNIFSASSSLVGRFMLLANQEFKQVQHIHEGILALGGEISLSTVSKVLKGLHDDLIISKTRGEIRLIQAEKLLDKLRDNYQPIGESHSITLKLPVADKETILTDALGNDNWVWSGETSAPAYTTAPPSNLFVGYTKTLNTGINQLRDYEDKRFYNVILKQVDDSIAYFDRRQHWASPVESYLELSQGDKRERELAESIRGQILSFKEHA